MKELILRNPKVQELEEQMAAFDGILNFKPDLQLLIDQTDTLLYIGQQPILDILTDKQGVQVIEGVAIGVSPELKLKAQNTVIQTSKMLEARRANRDAEKGKEIVYEDSHLLLHTDEDTPIIIEDSQVTMDEND